MKKEDILKELERISKELGYKVRFEKGNFSGGDCRVKENRVIVINKFLPLEGKISTFAQVLASIGVENVFIPPQVRKIIDTELEDSSKTPAE